MHRDCSFAPTRKKTCNLASLNDVGLSQNDLGAKWAEAVIIITNCRATPAVPKIDSIEIRLQKNIGITTVYSFD